MSTQARILTGLLFGCALTLVFAQRRAAASDIDIGERAGDVIGDIAQVTNDFKLVDIPANLEIEADQMTFDYDRGELSYSGKVRVHHGDVQMSADRLLLTFHPGSTKSLQTIKASGNVEVLRGSERATGDHATYDPGRRVITLTGKATLGSGVNKIGGASVIVDLGERRAEIRGSGDKAGDDGRVRAVIDPKSLNLLEEPASP